MNPQRRGKRTDDLEQEQQGEDDAEKHGICQLLDEEVLSSSDSAELTWIPLAKRETRNRGTDDLQHEQEHGPLLPHSSSRDLPSDPVPKHDGRSHLIRGHANHRRTSPRPLHRLGQGGRNGRLAVPGRTPSLLGLRVRCEVHERA